MRNQNKFRQVLNASASILALPVVGFAFAPSASGEAAKEKDQIIVTATRREGSVQDVPINIAAIGAAQLEEQGFADVSEVLSYIPGINAVDHGGRDGNLIIVRGINADPLGAGDSANDGGGTVATYLGEVPIYIDLKLNDLQRVEVLLGPQGTLYGAGTLGGAIRYIPNKPAFDDSMFEVRSDAYTIEEGRDISTDIGLTFNLPISDRFALRGSVDRLDDKGFIDYPFVVKEPGVSEPDPDFTSASQRAANFNPVQDANYQNAISGRLAARWLPTDAIDATLTYYFQDQDNGSRSTSGHRTPVPAGRYESSARVLEPNNRKSKLLALEITADLGFAELTSATGIGRYKEYGQRDQTDLLIALEYSYETFPTFTAFTREDQEEKTFNQEIRLVSTGEHRYNWIVGAFYNKFKLASSSAEYTPGYAAVVGSTRADDLEYLETDGQRLIEKAVFGEVGFDISDRWQVSAGGRYYDYSLQAFGKAVLPILDNLTISIPTLDELYNTAFDPTLAQGDNGFLFKVNSSFHVTDDAMVYGTISEGYRIGGVNPGSDCPAYPFPGQTVCLLKKGERFGPDAVNDVSPFDEHSYSPDKTRNFEIGAKTTWADGSIVFNTALFYVEWIGPQLSSSSVAGSAPITINAKGAATKGIETSASWQLTDQFGMRGTFSYTESELTDIAVSLIRTVPTTGGFGTVFEDGQKGDRLPGSPKTQFSIFANYDLPTANGDEWHFNAGYSWQGDVLSRTGARGGSYTLPSFGVANASVVYEADTWSITGYVSNLFGTFAETGVRSTARSNQTVSGATVRSHTVNVLTPRTFGLRAKYRFQ